MIKYIALAGTGAASRAQDWDLPDSLFSLFLLEHGIDQLVNDPLKRYEWSTILDGLDAHNSTWDSAARALYHYIVPPLDTHPAILPKDTYIIAHSHGGNVVEIACSKYGLKVEGLITVATPIRRDLWDNYRTASFNINRHLHIHAGWLDWWQVFGELFDGHLGITRDHPFAKNAKAPGGHGDILRKPELFHLWVDNSWLDYFAGTEKALLDKTQIGFQ